MGWDPQTQKPDREQQKAEKTEKWPEEEEKVVLGRAGEKRFKKEEKISASPSAGSELGTETCPGTAQGSHCDRPEHVPRGCGTGGGENTPAPSGGLSHLESLVTPRENGENSPSLLCSPGTSM